MSNIKLGVTTHSYVAEWVDDKATLEDMVRHIAELGCDGMEIVATSMFPEYPYVSDAYAGEIRRYAQDYGVKLVAVSGNMDRGKRKDRNLTDEEMLAVVIQDLQNANKLECPVLKSQFLISPRVMQRAAKYAEFYGVKLTIEIHNPETPSSHIMTEYYNMFEETGSAYLGFVPDFGIFADRPNKADLNRAIENGADREIVELATQLRYDGVSREEGRQILSAKNATPSEMNLFESMYGYMQFSKNPDFDGLRKIMKYCPHMHGKFFEILDDGSEATIPYDKILRVLYEEDYDGYVVSEFEGQIKPGKSSFDYVKRHIRLEQSILAEIRG
ncbi:sugar phosphate isomerase/epimerase [Muricomes sp. OA1]|uniref:Xylose isomerase n=1 Tax=Hungatella hathewayi TaxID=154046 RepID=A0A3E2WCP8_9FIRM|nr:MULTISPECIES: sugar phosphate isomerase/epimerase [Clostridia]MCH1973995.1 sugar phosphate isomerase/epimerase [Muricomes sp. OA1]MRM87859.1 xylose isomerase [Faecalicatena contorta]RGC23515.1 xylose isomerase [Hungatella hathewayi]GKH32771.1 xylose isomerase [Faecalicatena contorta]